MTAVNQDFSMAEGEAKLLVADQTDDEDAGGTLTISGGDVVTWILKHHKGGPEIVSRDATITDENVGAYEVEIQPSDTEEEVFGASEVLYYKIVYKPGGGSDESQLARGDITVEAA
jgi:hypothetical protein